MRWFALAAVLAAACVGCGNKGAKSAADESMGQADAARQHIQTTDPSARIGVVQAVLAGDRLAAVGDLPVAQFSRGDVVTFVDAQENPLVNGEVVNILVSEGQIHVKYEEPSGGKRAPKVGDLAVRFK